MSNNNLSLKMLKRDITVISLEAILVDVEVLFNYLNYFPDLNTRNHHATLYRKCVTAVAIDKGYTLVDIAKALLRSTKAIHVITTNIEEDLKYDKELHHLLTLCSKRMQCR